MQTTIANTSFINVNSNQDLLLIVDRIRSRIKSFRIETGRDLIKAKSILAHGKFGPWLQANFAMAESTAQHYMNAAKFVDKNPESGVLEQSAVMALAAPGTPEIVKSEVFTQLADGKVFTTKEIKARIAREKSQKRPVKAKDPYAVASKLPADELDENPSAQSLDLVLILQDLGLKLALAIFAKAFPDYAIIDNQWCADEL